MSVHEGCIECIYVMSVGCNSSFSRGIVRGSADVSFMHPRRAHMCIAVCTFVQKGVCRGMMERAMRHFLIKR